MKKKDNPELDIVKKSINQLINDVIYNLGEGFSALVLLAIWSSPLILVFYIFAWWICGIPLSDVALLILAFCSWYLWCLFGDRIGFFPQESDKS